MARIAMVISDYYFSRGFQLASCSSSFVLVVWINRTHSTSDIAAVSSIDTHSTLPYQSYKYLSYKERLTMCRLTTLEKRRHRGDLIEACKIISLLERNRYSGRGSLS